MKHDLKLVFTDIDGTRYYTDKLGDIVNNQGELVTLTQEDNIRAFLNTSPPLRSTAHPGVSRMVSAAKEALYEN